MILIKKQDRFSFDIFLDDIGCKELLNYVTKINSLQSICLDSNSLGFNNKALHYLSINKSEPKDSIVLQENQKLIFILEQEDIEYLIFRLKQYSIDKDFSPPELFNL
jgi:hypothetical protein